MDVYKLVEALDGEIVSNKAQVRVDGKWVIVGEVMGEEFALTEEGEALVAELGSKKPAKNKNKVDAPVAEAE